MTDNRISRELVVSTAAEFVRRHGPGALTMRGLAAELGTAVTAIYWHVGNREALLDEVVARTVSEMGRIEARGATPALRAESVALELRRMLRQRPHLIALVHERGRTELMMLPAQRALVHEAHAAGLRGARAAEAVRALQFLVVGFVLVERNRERSPSQHPGEPELWDAEASEHDRPLAGALAVPPDPDRLFAASVRALVGSLWPTPHSNE
ncbi:TetR/AcrR family transcriptional regulator [Streptacidiphilus sp. P02-A3a]|uniref:TetR/AcrR family transcriptional regulator n=1 Tax=Streptacidiphilus sp. P02-A3a TaxID=2704468 RepID=UPI0015F9F731|nr:TetR/AcrR family transcriptional regulator [Streptacidiphilus sp. P02-A3a]QMU68931.1 TetR/AcrR family transcriptional regulator [Streptacidiphilus sp. P02-A3a]